MSFKKVTVIFATMLFVLSHLGWGFGQAKFEILTPDPEMNQRLAGKSISEIDLIIYAEGREGLTIDPVLPPDWRWAAGKGQTRRGQRVEFIFWEGHVYANSVEVCAFRSREYPDLFTDRIKSNVFTIGMRKYDESLIFVATEEATQVELVIDEVVFGEAKKLSFPLAEGEATLIRIFPKEPPYRP